MVEYSPRMWNSQLNKKIIHVDFTPSEVYTFYRPDVEIASDIGEAIDSILEEVIKMQLQDPDLDSYPRSQIPEIFQKIRSEILERNKYIQRTITYIQSNQKKLVYRCARIIES